MGFINSPEADEPVRQAAAPPNPEAVGGNCQWLLQNLPRQEIVMLLPIRNQMVA